MAEPSFTPALFNFLSQLEANNEKVWFDANRSRYEADVRGPGRAFVEAMGPRLATISRHLVADPRAVGGSMFRINRDTRFSHDKTPYKTNTGFHFRVGAGKDAHAPGLYLHLEPEGCFAGVGLWRPEPTVAAGIRQYMADHEPAWRKAVTAPEFLTTWTLDGDRLVRPPKGFVADHPLIEDLKRKDFIAMTPLTDREVTAHGFADAITERWRSGALFMAFLCKAVGCKW